MTQIEDRILRNQIGILTLLAILMDRFEALSGENRKHLNEMRIATMELTEDIPVRLQ